jgi:hypothetical protein
MVAKSIVRLKITLDRVEPAVMRRITVRFGVRLERLHRIIQAAMGWSGGHLWEFRAGGTGWGPREDYEFGDGPHDASKATLLSVIEDVGVKTMRYIYDFGDDWQHTIKVERIFADVPGLAQPFLLEATGRCPPEDIGGPQGYREMLDALADPKHARHVELVERYGSFDPAVVDIKGLEAAVDALAAQTHTTTTRRKPSPASKSRP